jgi:peptidoglycan hydrolase-like protein with peptidoglycan-binding domain
MTPYHLSAAFTVGVLLMVPFVSQAAITSTLQAGSSGAQVSELQRVLATDATIYPEKLVTGYFGPLTVAAVMRYQCAHNIVCNGSATSTGYGKVGPATRASLNGTSGGVSSSGDVFAPIMSNEIIATTSTSTLTTISWTTNEPARSRVMYATSWPFLYATAASAADPTFDGVSSVTLGGLASTTTYYYVRESVDAAGNVMWTTARSVMTGS